MGEDFEQIKNYHCIIFIEFIRSSSFLCQNLPEWMTFLSSCTKVEFIPKLQSYVFSSMTKRLEIIPFQSWFAGKKRKNK